MLDMPLGLNTRRTNLRVVGQYVGWGFLYSVSVFAVTALRVGTESVSGRVWTIGGVLPWYVASGVVGGFLCGVLRVLKLGLAIDTLAFALAVLPTLFLTAWLDVLLPIGSITGFSAAGLLSCVTGLVLGIGSRVLDKAASRSLGARSDG